MKDNFKKVGEMQDAFKNALSFDPTSELPITTITSRQIPLSASEKWYCSVTVKDGEEFDADEFEISTYASSRQDAEAKAMKLAEKMWKAIQ